MMRLVSTLLLLVTVTWVMAQDATQTSPDLIGRNAPPPSPTPVLPELSALDQAFNQTGLGKEADEIRTRVEMRSLQNQVAVEPQVLAAKAAAEAATTDLEKRDRLREYYNLNYGLMS